MNLEIGLRRDASESGSASRLFWGIVCWFPIIGFVIPIAFAFVARNRFGHWPSYSKPDPKVLDLVFFHVLALLSYPIALASILVCLVAMTVNSNLFRRRDIAVFVVGCAMWTFGLPVLGDLFEWLAD